MQQANMPNLISYPHLLPVITVLPIRLLFLSFSCAASLVMIIIPAFITAEFAGRLNLHPAEPAVICARYRLVPILPDCKQHIFRGSSRELPQHRINYITAPPHRTVRAVFPHTALHKSHLPCQVET